MVYTEESITKAEKYFVNSVRRDVAGARLYIYTFTSSIESFDLLNCYGYNNMLKLYNWSIIN